MQCCHAVANMCRTVPVTHTMRFGSSDICQQICLALQHIFIQNLKKFKAMFTATSFENDHNAGEANVGHLNSAAICACVPIASLEALGEAACACLAALTAPLGYSEYARLNDNCLKLCAAKAIPILSVFMQSAKIIQEENSKNNAFCSEISALNALQTIRNVSHYFVQLFHLYMAPLRPNRGVEYTLIQSIMCGVPRRRSTGMSIGGGSTSTYHVSDDESATALENIFFGMSYEAVSKGLLSHKLSFLSTRSRNSSIDSLSSALSPLSGIILPSCSKYASQMNLLIGVNNSTRPRLFSNESVGSNNSFSSKISPLLPRKQESAISSIHDSISTHLKWTVELMGHVHIVIPIFSILMDPVLKGKLDVPKCQIFEDDLDGSNVVHNVIDHDISQTSNNMTIGGIGDETLCFVADAVNESIYDKKLVSIGCQSIILLLYLRCAAVRCRLREQIKWENKNPTNEVNKMTSRYSNDVSPTPRNSSVQKSPLLSSSRHVKSPQELDSSWDTGLSVKQSNGDLDKVFKKYIFVKDAAVGLKISLVFYNLLETHMNDRYMVENLLKMLSCALSLVDSDGLNYFLVANKIVPLLTHIFNRHLDSESIVVLVTRLLNNSISSYANLYPPMPLYQGSVDKKRDQNVYDRIKMRLKGIFTSIQTIENGGSGPALLHTTLHKLNSQSNGSSKKKKVVESTFQSCVNMDRHGVLYGIDGYGGFEICEVLVNALLQHPDNDCIIVNVFVCAAAICRTFSSITPIIMGGREHISPELGEKQPLNQLVFTELGICEIIPRLLRAHMTNTDVIICGCSILTNICMENTTHREKLILGPDCVSVLVSCLDLHRPQIIVSEWISRVMAVFAMCPNIPILTRLGSLGVCEAIMNTLVEHMTSSEVVLQCCVALGHLAACSTDVPSCMWSEHYKHNAQILLMETSFLISLKKVLECHMDVASVVAAALRAVYYVTINGTRALQMSSRRKAYNAFGIPEMSARSTFFDDIVDLSGLQEVDDDKESSDNTNEDAYVINEFDVDRDDIFVMPYDITRGIGTLKDNNVDGSSNRNDSNYVVDLYPLSNLIAEALSVYSEASSVDLLVCEWACLLISFSSNMSTRCRDAYCSTENGNGPDNPCVKTVDSLVQLLALTNTISGFSAGTNINAFGNVLSDVWSSLTSQTSDITDEVSSIEPDYSLTSHFTNLDESDVPHKDNEEIPAISLEAFVNPVDGCMGFHTGGLISSDDTVVSLSPYTSLGEIIFEMDFGRLHRALRCAALAIYTLCVKGPTYLSTQIRFAKNGTCAMLTKLLAKLGHKDMALCRAILKAIYALCDTSTNISKRLQVMHQKQSTNSLYKPLTSNRSSAHLDQEEGRVLFTAPAVYSNKDLTNSHDIGSIHIEDELANNVHEIFDTESRSSGMSGMMRPSLDTDIEGIIPYIGNHLQV